jgi:hypothetical protein
MPLESALIGYAAWASLAIAYKRGLPQTPPRITPPPRTAMISGYVLLALSAITAIVRFGPPIGVVAWLAELSAAGALIIVILSWRPKLALALAVPALAAAIPLTAALVAS